MDFEVRLYRPGDEKQIVPLLSLSFEGWNSLDFWRWKYQDNPTKMNLISVVLSGDRIIGVSGSIFKRIKIGNKRHSVLMERIWRFILILEEEAFLI